MSTRARAARPAPRRRQQGRSRLPIFFGIVVVLGAALVGVVLLKGTVNKAIDEFTLPLDHEDIIRQQSKEKGVDAALIAAVIDTESKFSVSAKSGAGARGLMQITPEAAADIARHSGATTFKTSDLSNPEINIKYGTYLLAERIASYGGNVAAALASYNAGPGPVGEWGGDDLKVENITYPETRAYVELVMERQKEYREKYASELGYGGG
jgi:soluble lytic murein transglycosylase